MKVIKKELITTLISEQVQKNIEEMGRETKSQDWTTSGEQEPLKDTENPDFKSGTHILSPNLSVEYAYSGPLKIRTRKGNESISMQTRNPETKEIEDNVIYPYLVRVSPNGKRLLMFRPFKDGKPVISNVGVLTPFFLDPEIGVIYTNLPRASWGGDIARRYGLEYAGPQKVMSGQEWSKRHAIYPLINEYFTNDVELGMAFAKCGIPMIKAQKTFDKPITDKEQQGKVGELYVPINYTGPGLCFILHSVRDEEDIETALNKIFDAIFKIESGEEPDPYVLNVTHQRRGYNKAQINGMWDQGLRNNAKKYFKLTPKYKLYKKSVQRGEMAVTLKSKLVVLGEYYGERSYVLKLIFSVEQTKRTAEISRGGKSIYVIPEITSVVTSPVPNEAINQRSSLTVPNFPEFYRNILIKGLSELKTQVLELDPGEILGKLMPDPGEVIQGYEKL